MDRRRLGNARLGAAVILVAALLPAVVDAQSSGQGPAPDGIYYTNSRTFFIPFTLDKGGPAVKRVLLHVSEDYGKSYQESGSVGPTESSFKFQARQDGSYWFTVQTVDEYNRTYPANVNTAPNLLKVCVDTQPPLVSVKAITPREASSAIEWDLRDENLDLQTLRAEFRPAGGTDRDWQPLSLPSTMAGRYDWNPAGSGPLEVRLQVKDKAGNLGKSSATVTPTGGRAGAGTAPRAPEPERGKILWVNSKRIRLNYQIDDQGPSGVKTVEIWYTDDPMARTWTKYPKEADPKAPIEIVVEREGRYGFYLVAKSGVDLGDPPPRAGDQPQIWVEVDTTAPVVRLTRTPEVGRGADKGNLTITWEANDKFLRRQPITLSYGETKDGPWKAIAAGIDNSRRYVWRMPEGLPYKFFVKVEAIDEAGNVGSDVTYQAVAVDLSIPKVRVLSVEAAAGAGTATGTAMPGAGEERQP
jgi:hypothetical protein